MTAPFQVTFDCNDPAALSRFWLVALDYKLQDPPPGSASWDDWLQQSGIPQEHWNDVSIAVDPAGVQPNLYFQKVEEGKVVKNRLHLDVRVSKGSGTLPAERRLAIMPKVEQLTAIGATKLCEVEEHGGFWVVLSDPEGNEFCIV